LKRDVLMVFEQIKIHIIFSSLSLSLSFGKLQTNLDLGIGMFKTMIFFSSLTVARLS